MLQVQLESEWKKVHSRHCALNIKALLINNIVDKIFIFIRFRDLERTSVPQATAEALEDVQLQTLANLVTPTEVVKKQSTLMHMLTLDCDKEALPTFPSWALTHLGTSTIYSHSSGVNQPGFLNGKFYEWVG